MLKRILLFILPFLLWLYLLRDFISGTIPLNMDTNTIYAVAKYYFNNVLNGVVPLWEPFIVLGRPFYAISICNLFNPITLLMPIFKLLGANYHHAFIIYIVAYFWVGCLGFYLVAKRLCNDRWLAYLAYLALMFSSLGLSLFSQLTFVEIIVPTIWFFYFLLAFAQLQNKGNFLGLSFSLMIILSSYLPFYFLTVFCVAAVLFLIVYFKETIILIKKAAAFKWKHWGLRLLCLAGICVSMGPLLSYKILDATGDAVSPGRHCQYTSLQECYDLTMNQKGGMLYQEIARSGGLGERFDIGYLFSHLDKMTYGSDSVLFIPFWIYVLLGLSLFLTLNRRTIFLSVMMVVIGLIGLGDSAPLHRFLFDHVFFFKYFRNLFFMGSFLIPLGILLGIVQLQGLLAIKPATASKKKGMAVGIVLLHAAFFIFLRKFHGVPGICYVTVIASMIFFIVYYLGGFRLEQKFWMAGLAVLLIAEPCYVMSAYSQNAQEFKCPLPSAHVVPQFAWQRPLNPATSACRIYQFVPYEDFWYIMNMSDAPAKVGFPQAAARWSFELSQRLGEKTLLEYATYKVYLYDDMSKPGVPVMGPSDQLKVKRFTVNSVLFETNFSQDKFLVYNDSFTQGWKAAIDGKGVELLRTNGAFKGVLVKAGAHLVEFNYSPPGGTWVYILTTIVLLLVLAWTIWALYARIYEYCWP